MCDVTEIRAEVMRLAEDAAVADYRASEAREVELRQKMKATQEECGQALDEVERLRRKLVEIEAALDNEELARECITEWPANGMVVLARYRASIRGVLTSGGEA